MHTPVKSVRIRLCTLPVSDRVQPCTCPGMSMSVHVRPPCPAHLVCKYREIVFGVRIFLGTIGLPGLLDLSHTADRLLFGSTGGVGCGEPDQVVLHRAQHPPHRPGDRHMPLVVGPFVPAFAPPCLSAMGFLWTPQCDLLLYHALCTVHYALCIMHYALCIEHYACLCLALPPQAKSYLQLLEPALAKTISEKAEAATGAGTLLQLEHTPVHTYRRRPSPAALPLWAVHVSRLLSLQARFVALAAPASASKL